MLRAHGGGRADIWKNAAGGVLREIVPKSKADVIPLQATDERLLVRVPWKRAEGGRAFAGKVYHDILPHTSPPAKSSGFPLAPAPQLMYHPPDGRPFAVCYRQVGLDVIAEAVAATWAHEGAQESTRIPDEQRIDLHPRRGGERAHRGGRP